MNNMMCVIEKIIFLLDKIIVKIKYNYYFN